MRLKRLISPMQNMLRLPTEYYRSSYMTQAASKAFPDGRGSQEEDSAPGSLCKEGGSPAIIGYGCRSQPAGSCKVEGSKGG